MPHPTLDLVGIDKVNSVDYLQAVMNCYAEGRVAVPVDRGGDAPAGHAFAERLVPAAGGGWFTRAQAPIREDRPGQVSFSSGTTGAPKAVLLSHRALADVTDRLIDVMGIDGEISEYLGVPATYSFGLGRARVCAAAGGRLFVPEHGFNPSELVTLLEAGEVNALSAVPTLLRMLIANPDLVPKKIGRRLRWLEIGSQAMSAAEKHAVRRIFPAARIIQHYGLTEASRTTFLDIQEASEEELASVGKPIGDTEVKIDADGRIAIRGPHVADGLLTAAGLEPITDADGWLRTSDLGRFDNKGFLFFEGRADFLLNVGGIKVPGELFETRLLDRLGAEGAHVAVAGRADPVRGEIVMVAHLAHVQGAGLAEHARAVGGEFGLGLADVTVIEVAEIPRTDTGKVQRKQLGEAEGIAAIAAAGAPPPSDTAAGIAAGEEAELSSREQEIAALWRDTLGLSEVGRNHNFFDIGGDSLSAITVMLKMERAGIPKEITQLIFQGRTVAEIAATLEGDTPAEAPAPVRRAEASDAITMTRGLLVGVVLAGHWSPFILERMGPVGAFLLYWLNPFFRFGTPGFAMVFGMGLAFFSLPLVTRHPDRLRRNVRTNALLLASGVAAVGLGRAAASAADGFDATWPSRLFYSVLAAYLLLVLTTPPILRFFATRRRPVVAALIASFLSLGVAHVLRQAFTAQASGIVDLARLLIAAKYGYAEMLGYALAGFAAGLWVDAQHEDEQLPANAAWIGLAAVIGGVALTQSLDLWSLWAEGHASPPTLICYLGAVLLLFGGLLAAVHRGAMQGPFRLPLRLLAGIGTLAFLIYVGQELVMSLHQALLATGVSVAGSLALLVGLFVLAIGIALRRLYRLYYG